MKEEINWNNLPVILLFQIKPSIQNQFNTVFILFSDQTPASAGGKQSTLPINLISAQNQQKIVTAQNLSIKQQLPLKLASKLSNSNPSVGGASNNNTATGSANSGQNSSANVSHNVVHGNQLLPLRLSQGNSSIGGQNTVDRRYSGGASMQTQGYHRLVDNDVSIEYIIFNKIKLSSLFQF